MNEKILLIDDEPNIKSLLARILGLEGFKVDTALNAGEGLTLLEKNSYQVLVTDVKLPDADGVSLVKKIKNKFPDMEIIVITAYGNINDGVSAMKNGAFDYIIKGGDGGEVILSVKNALEKIELKNQVSSLRKRIDRSTGSTAIISKSEEIQKALELARRVAVTDSTVLLLGETGTGKELFAQMIHSLSHRRDMPFIAINCSAIPKDLQESELFGYVKGAFTGAVKDKKGFFEEAEGGTLFLDEVADMNIDTQAKLLRFLETNTFVKVGDTRPTEINIRLISATNKDVIAEIEKGTLRNDLYYRLNPFVISLPPLRDRKEDIEDLAYYFLNGSKKLRKNIKKISDEFMQKLLDYSWHGNIRELKNVIERAMILADGDTLTPDLLPKEFFTKDFPESRNGLPSGNDVTLEELEKKYILKVYSETNHNKTLTAKKLGIGNATLYRKLKEYGIE
jgi:two-component system NtrC family response regulator